MSHRVLPPLELTLRAVDGLVLRGELRYPGRTPDRPFPLAVLAHQWPATRASWGPLVDDLLAAGVATLAFDLRGHGASTEGAGGAVVIETPSDFTFPGVVLAFTASARHAGFAHLPDDILRVANWGVLQNFVDGSRVVLVGASVGGSGVLVAAPRVPGLRAVATLGAAGAPALAEDGPKRVRAALEQLQAPAYLATSAGDVFDGANNARAWSKGLAHVRTRVVEGDAHAMAIYFEVRDELLRFLTGAVA
ncbi:MAG TPA: alpha/beta fold hydrolase [Gemmatimonadales bacterium]|nr:alpha/beta fold hydrolase [Gemmatimonadales bacterium]